MELRSLPLWFAFMWIKRGVVERRMLADSRMSGFFYDGKGG